MSATRRDVAVQNGREPTRMIVFVDAGEGARERLAAASQSAVIAAVVLVGSGSSSFARGGAADLLAGIRQSGAVALIADDVDLALSLAADGVHLSDGPDAEERYVAARTKLGKSALIGVDCGGSRHVAMTTAEAGADYVAFGPVATDEDPSGSEIQLDLVHWWAEIFETPCAALGVCDAANARLLADEGADFIAAALTVGCSPAAGAEVVRSIAEAITGLSDKAGSIGGRPPI